VHYETSWPGCLANLFRCTQSHAVHFRCLNGYLSTSHQISISASSSQFFPATPRPSRSPRLCTIYSGTCRVTVQYSFFLSPSARPPSCDHVLPNATINSYSLSLLPGCFLYGSLFPSHLLLVYHRFQILESL